MARLLRSFREAVGLVSRGDFARKLDEEMRLIIEALEAAPGEKGKATLTVTLAFTAELGRVDVSPSYKVKLPETARFVRTPFWIVDGALSVEHPNQIDMFSGPRGTREADTIDDAETA